MEIEKSKKRFRTKYKPKKWKWISPGYINLDNPVEFVKIEKESIIELPPVIPMELIKDKFLNSFYLLSKKSCKEFSVEILREG